MAEAGDKVWFVNRIEFNHFRNEGKYFVCELGRGEAKAAQEFCETLGNALSMERQQKPGAHVTVMELEREASTRYPFLMRNPWEYLGEGGEKFVAGFFVAKEGLYAAGAILEIGSEKNFTPVERRVRV